MLRAGTYLQERYEILELIGSGGMSDVYKAKCHKLNRYVAIKVLKEEFSSDEGFVSKFKMEAQAAACLSHPNIVSIYDVVDEGKLHYIVMELIEGITLKSYIAQKRRLDVKEAVSISIQVAQGIAAAHSRNIVHRDIKPQNIIISKDGKVKVADFGIARAATASTMTLMKSLVGMYSSVLISTVICPRYNLSICSKNGILMPARPIRTLGCLRRPEMM